MLSISCGSAEPSSPSSPLRISIAARVEAGLADTRQIQARFSVGDPSNHAHFNAGWYPPRRPARARRAAVEQLWNRGPAAALEVQLAGKSRLQVTLHRGPRTPDPRLPIQSFTVLWNDHEIGTLFDENPAAPLRFRVPTSAQALGLNRLVLLPHFWFDPSPDAQRLRETDRGFWLEAVEFAGDHVPEVEHASPARAVKSDFVQAANTVVTVFERLPEAARLTGRFEADSPTARGQIVIVSDEAAHEESKRTQQIGFDSRDVGGGPVRGASTAAFEIDLSPYAGRAVALQFVVSDPSTDASARWQDATLHGEQARASRARSRGGEVRGRDARPPNILVVLFDTLRADATEPYGAPAGSSPSVARLAREGTVFRNAFATGATTRVSVASTLTGLYPRRHGVVDSDHRLGSDLPYLPALLSDQGYRTIALIDNPQLAKDRGFARGFDVFEEIFRIDENELRAEHPDPRDRARVTWESHVSPALETRGDAPFFIYLHELDPHFPYEPLPPYDASRDRGYRGAPISTPQRLHTLRRFTRTRKDLALVNENRPWLGKASLDALRQRYAGEVAYMDAYLGWILDHLEAEGLMDETIVVFMSDHGEEFLEHGHFGHSLQVYEPAVRVPLVVSLPDREHRAAVIDDPVELLDLTPTLLRLAGVPTPADTQGMDLFAHVPREGSAPASRSSFSTADWRDPQNGDGGLVPSQQVSIRHGELKLIRNRHRLASSDFDTYELYDLTTDPGETINLWFTRPVSGHALRQRLEAQEIADAIAVADRAPVIAPIDAEARERLRALGYAE